MKAVRCLSPEEDRKTVPPGTDGKVGQENYVVKKRVPGDHVFQARDNNVCFSKEKCKIGLWP